jgi:RNA polymerase sigma-70 factor, ECF subfamily
VLILRDVLRWSAKEVAEALETSPAAVNSALQRAHAQLEEAHLSEDTVEATLTAEQTAMLDQYVAAFWHKDIDTIVRLLTREAVWEMPPFTSWYKGAEHIGALIGDHCPGGAFAMPMLPTTANGQPAFGLYMAQPDGSFTPFQLQVLELEGARVRKVVAFFDLSLFETFGLPARLEPGNLPPGFTTTPA